jgi:hypothetical protein
MCGELGKLEITDDEYHALYREDKHVQDAMPTRDASFREQFISGTHSECWEQMVGDL